MNSTSWSMRVVLMGVAGSGKTTVGRALADRLNMPFVDADDFHPPANRAKMTRGEPLNDLDRGPWLDRLNQELRERPAVLGCSALTRRYRARLAEGLEDLRWVYLQADFDSLRKRMEGREHFMPAALLQSQFDTLEPPTEGQAVIINAIQPIDVLVERIVKDLL